MKKISDFIVDKRHIVLSIVVILAIICVFLSSHVNVNRDISKYLPKDSETKIGMDIMDREFHNVETSTLNVMFKGLSTKEKTKIYKELESFKDVEVDYDSSQDYNKKDYTLYVLTGQFDKDSREASNLYAEVLDKYKGYDIYTSGDIKEENKEILPIYIVVLAIACATVILILMCDSFIEPFLFLLSIGIAIILNKGTNIIFGTISSITDSITAILQLALSMDYSIMLMSRYRQEKVTEKNNIKAMKNALYKAFSSIFSSSITTIVGLLALVFMSFTIGRDLGFILAKGVMFSLFTIFTCLPAFILMFDHWITKTKKNSPKFNLKHLGKYSHKIRYIAIPLFAIIFFASFLLKGNLTILYTDSEVDDIDRIFGTNNQMAIIYNNKYEDMISKYCKNLDEEEKIDEVLCYGNTINEKLNYQDLKKRISDFDSDMDIDDYLLKLTFYNYYNGENSEKMSFNELIPFIKENVYTKENMSKNISSSLRNDINRLENFTREDSMNQKRESSELASAFEIEKEDVDDLLIYYNSLNNNRTLTIDEFVDFMNHYVLNNKYSSSVSAASLSELNTVSKFTDQSIIQKNLSSNELSDMFGIDKNTVDQLYLYYVSQNNMNQKLTIAEFADFIRNNVLTDPSFRSSFDDDMKEKINTLRTFSDTNFINKKMDDQSIANVLGIDPNIVKPVYLLKFIESENTNAYTMGEFITYTLAIKENTNYLDGVDVSALKVLLQNQEVMSNPNKLSKETLAQMLGVDVTQINMIYNLIDYQTGHTSSWTLSPLEFVSFILDHKDQDEIKNNITSDVLTNLQTLQFVMNSTLKNVKYSYIELSNNLSITEDTVKNIYSLYVTKYSNVTISPYTFVEFILTHQNDTVLKNSINQDTINNLLLLKTIMDSTLTNKEYKAQELSQLFHIDQESVSLLYSLYDIKYLNKNITLSYREFTTFLLDHVMTNSKYNSRFTREKVTRLNTVNGVMNQSLKNTRYTEPELIGIISLLSDNVNKDLVDLLYIYYGSSHSYNDKWALTIEEFVDYLNNDILTDDRFTDFLDYSMIKDIKDSKKTIKDAKELLVGKDYSRVVLNTQLDVESKSTFQFLKTLENKLANKDIYLIGDSPMAYDLNNSFGSELNFITILTMIFIFIVVAFTFHSILIPSVLVMLIQTAVYLTMGILSFSGGTVYFIALLIVQSILMGATIDYAILYTSYYLETRKTMDIKNALITSYNKSIHTIFTSASILVIVTLIVGYFSTAIIAKICTTISQGTLCSTILILLLLPAVLCSLDRFITKKKN